MQDLQSDFSQNEALQDQQSQQEQSRLQEINEELVRENGLLRSQFEEAVKIADQMKEIHDQNSRLSSQLREASSQNDDYARRLEISLQTNKELESQLEEERKFASHQSDSTVHAKNAEMEKLKAAYQADADRISKELCAIKGEFGRMSSEHKFLQERVGMLLSRASAIYNAGPIENIDKLAEIIEAPSQNSEPSSPILDTKMQKRFLKLKSKLQAQKDENAQMKLCVAATQKEIASLKEYSKSLKEQSEESSKKKAQEIASIETESKLMIQSLQAKTEKLMAESERLKTENLSLQTKRVIVQQPLPEPQPKSAPEKDFDVAQEELLRRIAEISNEFSASQKKRDELSSQIKEEKSKVSKIQIENENLKSQLSSATVLQKENAEEIKSLREALLSKPKEILVQQPTQQAKIQQICDAQRCQIASLQQSNEKNSATIQNLQQRLKDSEASCNEAKTKAKSLEAEIESMSKAASLKPQTSQSQIPDYAWKYPEFDQYLRAKIDPIAVNSNLQPVTKLQNIYRTIDSHFSSKIKEKEASIEEEAKEKHKIEQSLEPFLADLGTALYGRQLSIGEFLESESEISKDIRILKKNSEELQQKVTIFMSFVHSMAETASIEANEPLECLKKLAEAFSTQKEEFEKLKKRLKKSKTKLHDIQNQQNSAIDRISTDFNSAKSECEKLKDMNLTSKCEVESLREKCQKLEKELEVTKADYAGQVESLEQNAKKIAEASGKQSEQMIASAKSIQARADSELKQTKSELDKLKAELARAKSAINSLRSEKKQKDDEIASLTAQLSEAEKNFSDKSETQRQNSSQAFEETIEKLRAQSVTHRGDIQKLTSELAKHQTEARKLKESVAQLRKSKSKLESTVKILQEQMEREKKLNETEMRMCSLSAESKANEKVEELRAKQEAEVRRIFSYAADEFRSFFDPSQRIGEQSFRSVISQVKAEIGRLKEEDSSIRRMVGAGPLQQTQEAVGQLLVNRM